MPIDYSIPLQGQVARFDPIRTMDAVSQLHSRRQQQQMDEMKLRETNRAMTMRTAMEKAFQDSGGDPLKASSRLRSEGWYEAADNIDNNLLAQRTKGLELLTKEYEARGQALKQVSQLLQGVNDSEGYMAVRDTARGLAGQINPQLAAALPDDYDADYIGRATQWGMNASDAAALRGEAARRLNEATKQAKDELDLHVAFLNEGRRYLKTVDSPEEWNQVLGQLKDFGAKPATLAMLQFSGPMAKTTIGGMPAQAGLPDAEAFNNWKAEQVALVDGDKKPEVGSFGHYLESVATGAKVKVTDLTPNMIENARRRWFAADNAAARATQIGTFGDFLPRFAKDLGKTVNDMTADDLLQAREKWGEDGVSTEQRAVIERWRVGEINSLNRRRAEASNSMTPMTDAEYQSAMDAIEKSARFQSGMIGKGSRSGGMGGLTFGDISPVTLGSQTGSRKSSFFNVAPPSTMGDITGRGPAPGGPPPSAPPGLAPPAPVAPPAPSPSVAPVPSVRQPSIGPAPAARPSPSPAAAPAPSPQASAPPAVVRLLSDRGPGDYRMSDGSVWRKQANGELSPLSPPRSSR